MTDEVAIQKYMAIKAMFIVRQAMQQHLANGDNSLGKEQCITLNRERDDSDFFDNAINFKHQYIKNPVTGGT